MTNQTINWVKAQQSMTPDKPFFVYYAPGATHAPHHVPKEWADRYKGQFDKGWDQVRNETVERQKKLGVIPADTRLADRRFRDALAGINELDNTLFIYIAGDNGTSAEGGFVGMYNDMTYFNGVAEKVEDLIPLIDKWVVRKRSRTCQPDGPSPSTRRSPGPSRWRPTLAARATASSSTGRRASRTRAACAASSRTSSTSRRRFSKLPACPNPRS
jgi:arylsulfatase A-like enzyme